MDLNNIITNPLDIILFTGIIISVVIGFTRGFIREVLSIVNWLLASWFAFKYYSSFKTITINFISSQIIADAISFGILFFLFIITFTIITNFISKNIRNSVLAPLDRIMGMFFGLIRALLLIIMLLIAGNQTIWINNKVPAWVYDSNSYPIAVKTITYIKNILPNEIFNIDIKAIDLKKINLNKIIEKDKLFDEPKVNINEKNESSYTPAEREQMDRLNNIETIDTQKNN